MSEKNWRDPKPEELETPEFNAVWEAMKGWDIAVPKELDESGLYSGTTGNHVVAILDALRNIPRKEMSLSSFMGAEEDSSILS
ncbi:hypothetical protein LCGC14_1189650 [marine sediment metagenome]|uniref:Uncharacterized protein n=1 Tax=marine sediment metagenome TaxID=412755 RepID=A0A0F9LJY8_9ZZZZ